MIKQRGGKILRVPRALSKAEKAAEMERTLAFLVRKTQAIEAVVATQSDHIDTLNRQVAMFMTMTQVKELKKPWPEPDSSGVNSDGIVPSSSSEVSPAT